MSMSERAFVVLGRRAGVGFIVVLLLVIFEHFKNIDFENIVFGLGVRVFGWGIGFRCLGLSIFVKVTLINHKQTDR